MVRTTITGQDNPSDKEQFRANIADLEVIITKLDTIPSSSISDQKLIISVHPLDREMILKKTMKMVIN